MDAHRGDAVAAVVHSLRAVGLPEVRALVAEANRRQIPLHLHLEEQPKEIEDCIVEHGVTPLRLLLDAVPKEQLSSLCAVHCTHSTPDELAALTAAGAGACVKFCAYMLVSSGALAGLTLLLSRCVHLPVDRSIAWRWCIQCTRGYAGRGLSRF